MQRTINAIKRWIYYIFTAAVCAALIGALAVPAAYAERGYWAIGGEWLLVLLSFVSALWLMGGREE